MNQCLMWQYLNNWQLQIFQSTFKDCSSCLFDTGINSHDSSFKTLKFNKKYKWKGGIRWLIRPQTPRHGTLLGTNRVKVLLFVYSCQNLFRAVILGLDFTQCFRCKIDRNNCEKLYLHQGHKLVTYSIPCKKKANIPICSANWSELCLITEPQGIIQGRTISLVPFKSTLLVQKTCLFC